MDKFAVFAIWAILIIFAGFCFSVIALHITKMILEVVKENGKEKEKHKDNGTN